jgi:Rod binding domain-containing protein
MKIALDPSTNSASSKPPVDIAKLRKSAQDFEAMLLSSLWKDMQLGFGEGEQGELGGNGGPLQEVAFQALAGQAVKSRGIGIAQMVVHSLGTPAQKDGSQTQPGTLSDGQKFMLHPDNIQVQGILPGGWAALTSTPTVLGAYGPSTSGRNGGSTGSRGTGAMAPAKH